MDVGGATVGGLEQPVGVADFRTGGHPHATDETTRQVGKNIAEHILHDQHVEIPGPANQVECLGVDIVIRTFHSRESCGTLVEDLSKKGHGVKHVGLVYTGHTSFATARLAPLGETKREVV